LIDADFWLSGATKVGIDRLALVSVSPDGPERGEVRYIADPFRDVDFGDFAATGVLGNWTRGWERGGHPVGDHRQADCPSLRQHSAGLL
jgi:hypothetical protein